MFNNIYAVVDFMLFFQFNVLDLVLPARFRYNNIFFMIDTCQAASMYEKFYSPNILAVASSQVGEDSLSVSGECPVPLRCSLSLSCPVYGIQLLRKTVLCMHQPAI